MRAGVALGVIAALCLLAGCSESSVDPKQATGIRTPEPMTSTAAEASEQPARDTLPYTILDVCGAGPYRKPTGFALACGDAGIYVGRVRYDKFSDEVAKGTGIYTLIPSTQSQAEELGRSRFPVQLRAYRVRVWREQPMFTRLHLTFLDGRPPGAHSLYVIPLYGPHQHEDIPTGVQTYLAAHGSICRSADLAVNVTGREGAGGWNVAGFRVRNISENVCALRGPVTFRGLDKSGAAITSTSTCYPPSNRPLKCSAPIILFPRHDAQGKKRPNEVVTQIYGWGRGGPRETTCPSERQVRPAAFQITYGGLTLVGANRHGERAMWGCDEVGIATHP